MVISHSILFAGLLNFTMGIALGAIGGLFGIGGGLIAIPALALLYGFDQQLAQGTTLIMIVPNVLIGLWRYRQRYPIDLRTGAMLGLTAAVSTWPAARLATGLDARLLRFAFAIFLFLLALYFIRVLTRKRAASSDLAGMPSPRLSRKYLPAVGVLGGVFSGFFSVGGGLIAAPLLVSLFGVAQAGAQGMALALVTPGAIVALLTYAWAGHVDWLTGIELALGGAVSVSWGVSLAYRLPERRLRLWFSFSLIATSILMMARG